MLGSFFVAYIQTPGLSADPSRGISALPGPAGKPTSYPNVVAWLFF